MAGETGARRATAEESRTGSIIVAVRAAMGLEELREQESNTGLGFGSWCSEQESRYPRIRAAATLGSMERGGSAGGTERSTGKSH